MAAQKKQLNLPSVLTEDSWFYKEHKDLCEPYLGRPYISYSTASSWSTYREDMIKQKFVGIELPDSPYTALGSYVGEAIEKGEFAQENPYNFTGAENIDLSKEHLEHAEYEKMVIIDRGSYIILGFIDRFIEEEDGCTVEDYKTGGSKKEKEYESEEYCQVVLYAHGIELTGKQIKKTGVRFIRRSGSHINPPLNITKEQFYIPLEYDEKRVKYALKKMDKAAREIASCYTTYKKIFG